jgi:hypothetical protein
MNIEGEPSKRYKLPHGGEHLGSFDTAGETLQALQKYDKTIRHMIEGAKRKWRYAAADGRETISMEELGRRAKGGK